MKYKLQAFDILEFGQRKDSKGNPHQEDCLFPGKGLSTCDDRLFIVCDGMGGHDAGEVASATVCDTMSKFFLSNIRDPEGDFSDQSLVKAVEAAFTALNLKDTGATRKMGTTMVMLKLHSRGCTIAHMGDSRVYQIRPGKTKDDTHVVFVTEDHSLVNELVKCGEITKEEARVHPKKNVITRALQPNMERYPKLDVYHSSDIRPGDYFYLCTDGMLENMDDEQLCYFFSVAAGNDTDKISKLIRATVNNKDNHTAIIVHILDVINPIGANAVSRKTISLAVIPECHYDSNGLTNNRLPSSGFAQEEKTGVIFDGEASIPSSSKLPSNQYNASLGSQTNPGISPTTVAASTSETALGKGTGEQDRASSYATLSHPSTQSGGYSSNRSNQVEIEDKGDNSSAATSNSESTVGPTCASATPEGNKKTGTPYVTSQDTLAESFKKGYETGKKNGWISIVAVVVILLIGAFFLMQNCSGANSITESVPTTTENIEKPKANLQGDNKDRYAPDQGNRKSISSQTASAASGVSAESGVSTAENPSSASAEVVPTQASIGEAVEHVSNNITTAEGKLKEELTEVVNQSKPKNQSQSPSLEPSQSQRSGDENSTEK